MLDVAFVVVNHEDRWPVRDGDDRSAAWRQKSGNGFGNHGEGGAWWQTVRCAELLGCGVLGALDDEEGGVGSSDGIGHEFLESPELFFRAWGSIEEQ